MKKCSNQPDYKLLEFKENTDRKNIYDLQTTSANFNKFNYFRLEPPKQPYLLNIGAKYVCESWNNGVKILHTGLINFGISNYYLGDYYEFINGQKKTSLMIFEFIPETNEIKIYYFNHFNKRSIPMKLEFCRNFIKDINKKEEGTTPPLKCSNYNLTANVR